MKLTVAIPTYNRKEYLVEALKSVQRQFFRDFEVIVFDNHSDYDVAALLDCFNDKRIKLVGSDKNIGQYENFKRIFEYPFQSEYVCILHDDDRMHPDFLAWNVKWLDCNPDVVFSISEAKFINNDYDMNFFWARYPKLFWLKDYKGLVQEILKGRNICFDSAVYRTKFLKPDMFYESMGRWSDRPFLIDLAKNGFVLVSDFKGINYRVHESQDSHYSGDLWDDVEKTKELFYYYYTNIRSQDFDLYFQFASDNIIAFAGGITKDLKDFFRVIKVFQLGPYFRWTSLSWKGYYYLLRAIFKKIFR